MADTPQLYLVTPLIEDAAAFAPRLAAACAAAPVAAVHLVLPDADERTTIKRIKALAPAAQETGAAVLVTAPPQVAVRGGADGVHLSVFDEKALSALLSELQPERIVGIAGIETRDEAMAAGEAGVDYVMFGEPDAEGRFPPLDDVIERVSWWAELFSVPCVGFAPTLADAERMAETGAEFVALGDAVFGASGGEAEAVKEAAKRIRAGADKRAAAQAEAR